MVSALPPSVCYHTSEEGESATEEDREGERGNKTQLPHSGKEKLPHSLRFARTSPPSRCRSRVSSGRAPLHENCLKLYPTKLKLVVN